ncbi:hypothetical protein Bbelb_234000 [Branchiostoma belcheri]|nr:hypothetical protein Bbelb_234000 [Branchiostoma belcheri]
MSEQNFAAPGRASCMFVMFAHPAGPEETNLTNFSKRAYQTIQTRHLTTASRTVTDNMKTAFIIALIACMVLASLTSTEGRSLAESAEPHSLVKRGFLFGGGSRCGYNFVCNLGPAQGCYHSSGCCMRYVCN